MTKAASCRHVYFDLPCTDILKNRHGNVILKKLIIASVHRGAHYLRAPTAKPSVNHPLFYLNIRALSEHWGTRALSQRLPSVCPSICPAKKWPLKPDPEAHSYDPGAREAEAAWIQRVALATRWDPVSQRGMESAKSNESRWMAEGKG